MASDQKEVKPAEPQATRESEQLTKALCWLCGKFPIYRDRVCELCFRTSSHCSLCLRNPRFHGSLCKHCLVMQEGGSICPYCDIYNVAEAEYRIQISSMESAEDSWIAQGKGVLVMTTGECFLCGAMYEAIMKAIPIDCQPFRCPKCNELEHLEYKISKIDVKDWSFEFKVEIRCTRCRNKTSMKKIIKQILAILKIEIGSSGITVKSA
jgi:hypothetical protein